MSINWIQNPSGLAVSPADGELYVADSGFNWIIKIDREPVLRMSSDGNIAQIIDPGKPDYIVGLGTNEENEVNPALEAKLNNPTDIEFNSDGKILYIADTGSSKVKKLDIETNIVTTIAGQGENSMGNSGDGYAAVNAQLMRPANLAVDPVNGNLYIADSVQTKDPVTMEDMEIIHNNRIRVIDFASSDVPVIKLFAGTGSAEDLGNEGNPRRTDIFHPWGMAVSPDGGLYFSEELDHRIRRVGIARNDAETGEVAVPSEDGSQIYVFDTKGTHLRTVDRMTGVTVFTFGYTEISGMNYLTSITDRDGNTYIFSYTIDNDVVSHVDITPPEGLVPDGFITTMDFITEDGINKGMLIKVTTPDPDAWYECSYHDTKTGLLTGFRKPHFADLEKTVFEYDENGRLISDTSVLGTSTTLEKVNDSLSEYHVTMTSPGMLTTEYRTEFDTGKDEIVRTVTGPDGVANHSVQKEKESEGTLTKPDGTTVTTETGPDPEFGMKTPMVTKITTVTGGENDEPVFTNTVERERVLEKSGDEITAYTDITKVVVDGQIRTAQTRIDLVNRTITSTSPEGRKTYSSFDEKGRVISSNADGILPVEYTYDELGRLTEVTSNEKRIRNIGYVYENGHLIQTSVGWETEAMVTRNLDFDMRGRVTRKKIEDPDLNIDPEYLYSYDLAGNIVSIDLPEYKNDLSGLSDAHHFSYDSLGQQTGYEAPQVYTFGGDIIPYTTEYYYDNDKRPTRVEYPDGRDVAYYYNGTSGRLETLSYENCDVNEGAEDISCTTDRSINYSYEPDGAKRLVEISSADENSTETIAYTYNGSLPLTETISGTVNGVVEYEHNGFFELTGMKVNGREVNYEYDNDGLLTKAGELEIREV